jgi:hypothetical protein
MKFYKSKKWLYKQYCIKKRRLEDIGEELNVTRYVVWAWVKKFNLKRPRIIITKPNRRKYKLDENYFKKINTEEKAYWLGFIAADGSVGDSPGKRILGIELSKKDEKHLIKFKNVIKYEGPLQQKKARIITSNKTGKKYIGSPSVCLHVCHCDFVKSLIDLGIMANKSKTLQPPPIKKKYYRHWIRGLFDGDGSIALCHNGRTTGEFFGTENVIRFVVDNIPSTETVSKKKNCKTSYYHSFYISNIKKSLLYKYLYKDATIYLKRKKKMFEMAYKGNRI